MLLDSGLTDEVVFIPDLVWCVQARTVSRAAAARLSVTQSSVHVTWQCVSATQTSASPAEPLTTGTAKMSRARTAAFREELKRCKYFKFNNKRFSGSRYFISYICPLFIRSHNPKSSTLYCNLIAIYYVSEWVNTAKCEFHHTNELFKIDFLLSILFVFSTYCWHHRMWLDGASSSKSRFRRMSSFRSTVERWVLLKASPAVLHLHRC